MVRLSVHPAVNLRCFKGVFSSNIVRVGVPCIPYKGAFNSNKGVGVFTSNKRYKNSISSDSLNSGASVAF